MEGNLHDYASTGKCLIEMALLDAYGKYLKKPISLILFSFLFPLLILSVSFPLLSLPLSALFSLYHLFSDTPYLRKLISPTLATPSAQ
jgi:hypothetical protein